jgi:mannose-6-phosphate isomerase
VRELAGASLVPTERVAEQQGSLSPERDCHQSLTQAYCWCWRFRLAGGERTADSPMSTLKSHSARKLSHPLSLKPRPEARVWGGRRLAELFGRELPPGAVGESWEVHGELLVEGGPFHGRSLNSLVDEYDLSLLGRRGQGQPSFPLLTKWLDCREWLSVQVHPDDALAQELTGEPHQRGKSEAWYIAESCPEASLIHGLQGHAREVAEAQGAAVLPLLRKLSPAPGEVLFTPAGTVHALGPGFLIYEVQQSSDLTYRLYDWERDRPLHPEASRRCLLEAVPVSCQQDERGLRCRYFEIESLQSATCRFDLYGETFLILAAVQGAWRLQGEFSELALAYGDTVVLPASLGAVKIEGEGRLLKIGLGDQTV